MSKSRRSSNASASFETARCRFDWRPSRGLIAALRILALLAPFSLLASDLPRALAWPLAMLVCAVGLAEARRYAMRPAYALLIPAGAGEARCDGARMDALCVRWRGPLAFLHWCGSDGRLRRLAFWPDTLDAAGRRELRLAMQRREAAAGAPSMAG